MVWGIRYWGNAGPGGPHIPEGSWLKSHVDTPDGRGWTEWTLVLEEAKTFQTNIDAMEFWRQQSCSVPLRPDGRPNRPLTAFHVEIAQLP